MAFIRSLFVYTALILGANSTLAAANSTDHLQALKQGDMKKLVLHETPIEISERAFLTQGADEGRLSDFVGQYILLNFWATWCAPCRKEMPSLSALQTQLGDARFKVVTIATGRNAPKAMQAFFDALEIKNLPLYRDPKQKLAKDMAVLGLPMTLLISPQGKEVARLRGEADWASAPAQALLRAWIQPTN